MGVNESSEAGKVLWRFGLSVNDAADIEGIGSIRWVGNKAYRYVQNKHTVVTVGAVVFHTFSDGADAVKYVRDGATADLGYMAGIVMATSLTADYFGWIQVLGYNASALVLPDTDATPAAGATLKGTNALLTLDGQTVVAMGTAPIYTRNCLLLEAVTIMTTPAGTATKVWVNCL